MEKKRKFRISNLNTAALIAIAVITVFIVIQIGGVTESFSVLQKSVTDYSAYQTAFSDMKDASAYLTSESRYFAATGDREHLDNYMTEVNVTKRRDKALETISGGSYGDALTDDIERAAGTSNELALIEMYAMSLAAESYGLDISDAGFDEFGIALTEEDHSLTPDDKRDKAISMLFDDRYADMKDTIEGSVYTGVQKLVGQIEETEQSSLSELRRLLGILTVLTVILAACALAAIIITMRMLALPMKKGIEAIRKDEKLSTRGAYEYAALADAYNREHEKKAVSMEALSYEASHDELTGIYNRKMFEQKRLEVMSGDCALIIVDVDLFKSINDTYGHSTGDEVIKKTARLLADSFRSNDYVCRIGGDEFAVLLSSIKPEYSEPILEKIQSIRDRLRGNGDLPDVTLSIGIAFRDSDSAEDLFKKADAALYESKRNGRNRTTVYSPDIPLGE